MIGDLTLVRKLFRADGIFSDLLNELGLRGAETLEHAYPDGQGFYLPKIPNGRYKCVRGMHRLHGMAEDFETFEITGVAGHEGLLFHWGNFNKDSEGCVLVGEKLAENAGQELVTNSRASFAKFLASREGLQEFWLTVVG